MMTKNQNDIRREYRFAMVNKLSQELEAHLKKHNLSVCDFSRIMSKQLKCDYPNWPRIKMTISLMMSGRGISDRFTANVKNVMSMIESDNTLASRVLGKKRVGFKELNVGQTVESRVEMFKAEKTVGSKFVSLHMLRAMK